MFKFLGAVKNTVNNNRRCVQKYALLFGICVTLGVTVLSPVPTRAAELTNESIKQKEASIQASKEQRSKIQSSLSDIEAVKAELEKSKGDLTEYVTELDAKTTQIQQKIDDLKTQIEEKEEEIVKTEAELKEAERVQKQQYETMKERIRFIYERGDSYYLQVLLESGSFSDMLNKSLYISRVSDYDTEQLRKFKEQTALVKATKEDLDEQKKTLDEARTAAETEQKNIEELIAEKSSQIESLNGDIADKEQSIEAYQQQIAQENAAIAALENLVAAEKAALAEQNRRHFNGGVFTWPCPSSTNITSEYGYRVHPIFGDNRFHSGIDIGASSGASILAAADGTVVAASYESSMGNYVMIDHGDSLYTIYMHCSALYVSKGQDVSAGQQIAAVGSTGNSTGPHLHFSVRLNGSYVSPWNYLG